MTTKKDSDMAKKMDQIRNLEQEKRGMLRELLDSMISTQEGHLLACSAQMGGTLSYVTSVPMEWVAAKIRYAGQLPVFEDKGKSNPVTKEISVDKETVDYLQQRSPDWTRQIAMTVYLLAREIHKFPPLLVVAYQDWVYDERSDEWNGEIATKNSISALPLDNRGKYFDLNTSDTKYYALDGQHRLMAIQGIEELMKKQSIQARRRDGTIRSNKGISLDQIVEWLTQTTNKNDNDVRATLEKIMSESIGIEIMPAVIRGETHKEAVFRLRKIFIDVNENAKQVTKGERHLLDEKEGFRIIARNALISCQLLTKNGEKHRTNIDKVQLSNSDEEYTTLDTVVNIAELYLQQFSDFSKWAHDLFGFKDFGKIRPDDHDLEDGTRALQNYFNAISKLPSHKRFIQGKNASKIRMRPEDGDSDCEDNVLFRPIAQMALAKALGSLLGAEGDIEESMPALYRLIKKISRQEDKGQLKLTDPQSPWFGVLWHPIDKKMRNSVGHRELATRLFTYLLGGGFSNGGNQESLKEELWEARFASDDETKKAYKFDGELGNKTEFDLPHPWQ